MCGIDSQQYRGRSTTTSQKQPLRSHKPGRSMDKHVAVVVRSVSSSKDAVRYQSTGSTPTPSTPTSSFDPRRVTITDSGFAEKTTTVCGDGSEVLNLGDTRNDSHVLTNNNNNSDNHHDYMCFFHTLSCHETFDNIEHWKTHILSHFRAHPPPNTARCPLCPDEEKFTSFSPSSSCCSSSSTSSSFLRNKAWELMLDHVIAAHYNQGQTLAGSRPDFELMRYLYRLRIINDAQFKTMQLPPPPSSPAYHRSQDSVRARIGSADEPYCAAYNHRRERRLRSQRRGICAA